MTQCACSSRFRSLAFVVLVTAAAATALLAPTAPAHAQMPAPIACAPRTELVKRLADEYHETRVAAGIANGNTAVFEVLSSADGRTWTLLYSLSSGISCPVATGEDWQSLPLVALGPET
jgi:hypothetical protein